jgi:hypothetical protein
MNGISSGKQIDPGGSVLQSPIHGRLQMMNSPAPHGQARRARNGLHPNAGFVGIYLAISIGSHAAARPIAQIFWAAHGAGEPGLVENTLPAHPAIERYFLADLFEGEQDPP